MPEHDCLPPDISATEFVTHMGRMSGLPATAARERAAEALRHVGLHEERYRQIGTYSTGMKQRVKLAQALAGDPRLLLLDEPTNGLDPAGRNAMLELIERIGDEFGISIVVARHLLGEIERICDRLVAIEGGRLLRADTIDSFTRASQTLLIEVEEGLAALQDELTRRGLRATAYQRGLLVPIGGDAHLRRGPRHRRRARPAAQPPGAAPPPGRGDLPRRRPAAESGTTTWRPPMPADTSAPGAQSPPAASSTTSATGATTARGSAARRSSRRSPGTASGPRSASAGARRPRSSR